MKVKVKDKISSTQINSETLKDVKEGVGILEKLANIFISIFSIFKSKEK